jgi:hypothetical protein
MKKVINAMASFMFLLVLIFFMACGKVTQVAQTSEDAKSFSIKASVGISPTQSMKTQLKEKSNITTKNYFTVLDEDVYTQIVSIEENGKFNELSWGKSCLALDFKPIVVSKKDNKDPGNNKHRLQENQNSSANNKAIESHTTINAKEKMQKIYVSTAYNKSGVKTQSSSYKRAYINFKKNDNSWEISATKLELGPKLYLIKFFSTKDKYYFKLIEASLIEENKSISLKEITLYDTFITIMYLKQLEDNNYVVEDIAPISDLTKLFDLKFFHESQYNLSENKAQKFDIKNPVFLVNRDYEHELLRIYKIVLVKEKEDAIKNVKDLSLEILNKKAKDILIKNINSYLK